MSLRPEPPRRLREMRRLPVYCSSCSCPPLFHCIQDLFQGNRSECCGVVGYPVGDDQLLTMHKAAARVNDIRHVSIALVYVWLDQWFRQPADNFCWVVKIQQERPD